MSQPSLQERLKAMGGPGIENDQDIDEKGDHFDPLFDEEDSGSDDDQAVSDQTHSDNEEDTLEPNESSIQNDEEDSTFEHEYLTNDTASGNIPRSSHNLKEQDTSEPTTYCSDELLYGPPPAPRHQEPTSRKRPQTKDRPQRADSDRAPTDPNFFAQTLHKYNPPHAAPLSSYISPRKNIPITSRGLSEIGVDVPSINLQIQNLMKGMSKQAKAIEDLEIRLMSRDTAFRALEFQVRLQDEEIASLKEVKLSCPICAQDWSAMTILERSSHILEHHATGMPPITIPAVLTTPAVAPESTTDARSTALKPTSNAPLPASEATKVVEPPPSRVSAALIPANPVTSTAPLRIPASTISAGAALAATNADMSTNPPSETTSGPLRKQKDQLNEPQPLSSKRKRDVKASNDDENEPTEPAKRTRRSPPHDGKVMVLAPQSEPVRQTRSMTRKTVKATNKEAGETEDVPLPKPGRKSRKTGKAGEKAEIEPLQKVAAKRKRGASDEMDEEVWGSKKKILKR